MSVNTKPQAYTFPSVTIQQLIFTAKRWGQFPTITYTNGATAGSEVVTMDSSFNITIQISNGVSTNAQIAAALAAATQANGMGPGDICSAAPVGGHASDTPTCYSVLLAGGVAAAKAQVNVGPMNILANSAGTAGNSITVQILGTFNFTVTTVTDATHLVVSSSAGLIAGSPIKQGANSTTVTSVTDSTHIVVGSTTGWSGSGAAASSTITPGSEVGVINGNAIQVQILPMPNPKPYTPIGGTSNPDVQANTGVFTTWNQLVTAINAISSVTVAASFLGTAGKGPYVQSTDCATYSLAGGVAAAAATTGAVNSLTCAANATGTTANGVVVTLIPGGTAGSEVVTAVTGGFTVQIQSGTSTVTQVRTALNAAAAFNTLYTATGTSATAMQAVYQVSLTGSVGSQFLAFYSDNNATALTSSFVYFPFGSMAQSLHVENDDPSGSNTVIGSFDGINNHFIIAATKSQDLQFIDKAGIYLKFGTGAPAYKIWTVNN